MGVTYRYMGISHSLGVDKEALIFFCACPIYKSQAVFIENRHSPNGARPAKPLEQGIQLLKKMKKTSMMVAAIAALSMAVAMTSCKKEDKNGATDSSNSGTCTCTYHDFETGERYTETVSKSEAGVTRCDAMDAYVAGSFELSCK